MQTLRLGVGDYRWIAPIMRLLEVRSGPFWEPSRPHPVASSEDALAAARDLETLLERLVRGRRIPVIAYHASLGAFVGCFALALVSSQPVRIALVGLAAACAMAGGSLVRFSNASEWIPPTMLSYNVVPWRPAPPPDELVGALQTLCDRLIGAGPSAVGAIVAMRGVAPLSYEAAVRLTVVNAAVQRAARAA